MGNDMRNRDGGRERRRNKRRNEGATVPRARATGQGEREVGQEACA